MSHTLFVTNAERQAGQIGPQTLAAALDALEKEGFVLLENVADTSHIDTVYRQMLADLDEWNAKADEPVVKGSFTPSRRPELLFPDIIQNPIVAAVMSGLMGKEACCGTYTSNVTLPGRGEQDLHVDMLPHKADADLSGPCHAVVVNFPLVDFTIENGATEIWPGTHRIPREPGEQNVSQRLQDARRAEVPPVRAVLRRGGVMIRDMRLWHRGTTNHCDYLRPMTSMICNGGFQPGVDPIDKIVSVGPFPEVARPLFCDNPAIYFNVDFVSYEIEATPGAIPKGHVGKSQM